MLTFAKIYERYSGEVGTIVDLAWFVTGTVLDLARSLINARFTSGPDGSVIVRHPTIRGLLARSELTDQTHRHYL